jgi:hypothetical protein
MKTLNKSMEPTGASGSAYFEAVGQWPLAPAAHAQRSLNTLCPALLEKHLIVT